MLLFESVNMRFFLTVQVAVIRSKKTFHKKESASQGRNNRRSKNSDIDEKCHKDDKITDVERNEMMLAWAMNYFHPEGPESFALSSGSLVINIIKVYEFQTIARLTG